MNLARRSIALALVCGSAAAAPRPPMIPAEVAMRAMTPAEESAHRIWSLRAALNVAALQCQFSPYLRTVSHYNDMLKQHSAELDGARKTLAAHFLRYDGKIGSQRTLDQYTTRTYNSYSTLDAQIGFCDAASMIGSDVLFVRKGQLASFAAAKVPELRASLTPNADPLTRVDIGWADPRLPDPCPKPNGERKSRC